MPSPLTAVMIVAGTCFKTDHQDFDERILGSGEFV